MSYSRRRAHALKSAMLPKRKPLPSDDSSHPTTGQFDAMTRMMDMFDRMLKLATAQNGKKIPTSKSTKGTGSPTLFPCSQTESEMSMLPWMMVFAMIMTKLRMPSWTTSMSPQTPTGGNTRKPERIPASRG